RRALEDLAAHGLISRFGGGQGKPDYWRATDWTLARWPGTFPEIPGGVHTTHPSNGVSVYMEEKTGKGKSNHPDRHQWGLARTEQGEWRLLFPDGEGWQCCMGLWVTREKAVLHAQSHGREIEV